MATLTDPDVDANSVDTLDSAAYTDSGIDQLESFANNPANASNEQASLGTAAPPLLGAPRGASAPNGVSAPLGGSFNRGGAPGANAEAGAAGAPADSGAANGGGASGGGAAGALSGAAADAGGAAGGGIADKGAGLAAGAAGSAIAGPAGGAIAKVALGFVSKHRKSLLGGGAGTIFLALLVFLFLAAIPLKLESMIKNLAADALGPIESAMEHRVERIVLRLVLNRAVGGGTIATGSILSDVWANRMVIKTEAAMLEKGVKIERGSSAGRIKVTRVDGVQGPFEGTIDEFLNKDLSSNDARALIRKAAKDTTRWNQVLKRHHIRENMRKAYNIRRWKWLDKKAGKAASKEVTEAAGEAATKTYLSRIGSYIGCMLGSTSSCPGDSANEPNINEGKEARTPEGNDAEKALQEGIEQSTKEAATEAGKITGKEVSKAVEKKLVVKLLPWIGWVDLAARLDNFLWENGPAKIVADKNKVQYAAFFGFWATNASAMHLGEASADEVNELMKRLEGIEKSKIYQHIYANSGEEPHVTQWAKVSTKYLDAGSQFYRANPLNWPTHAVGYAWLHTLGKILDWFGNGVAWVLKYVPGADTAEKFIGEVVVKVIGVVLFPVVTGAEVGADLFDAAYAGVGVIANDTAHEMGGIKFSDAEAAAFDHQMALEQDAEEKLDDPVTRLVNLDNPRSLGSRVLAAMPISLGDAASRSGSGIMTAAIQPISGAFKQLGGIFGSWYKPALAGTPYNPYELQYYRFTIDQTRGEISQLILDGKAKTADDCRNPDINPEAKVKDGPNKCLFDMAAIDSIKPVFTNDDDGGLGGGTTGGGGGDSTPADCGDAAACAKAILARPTKVTFVTGGAKQDLENTAAGRPVGSCGLNGPVNAKLLSIILKLSDTYKIGINNFVTGHDCNGGEHPKGKAFDVNFINDKPSTPSQGGDINLDIEFVRSFWNLLPTGGGQGQEQCFGTRWAPPSHVAYFNDGCNHLHIDVRGN